MNDAPSNTSKIGSGALFDNIIKKGAFFDITAQHYSVALLYSFTFFYTLLHHQPSTDILKVDLLAP